MHHRGRAPPFRSALIIPRRQTAVLCSRQLAYAPLDLTVGAESVALGTAEVAIRSLANDPEARGFRGGRARKSSGISRP